MRSKILSNERGECVIKYIGICANKGLKVEGKDALCYAMLQCGIQITTITNLTKEFADMLVDWYFSGNWIAEKEAEL